MTHILHFLLTNTMVGFWEDDEYNINSMYESNIPWVATRSMSVSLRAMHESRIFFAYRHYEVEYNVMPHENNPIGNWMKKIEMMRNAPVWGFCDDDDILYLVEKNIYDAGEDADILVEASTIYDWDMDVSRCTEFDPSDPANIAMAEEENMDHIWYDEDEENAYRGLDVRRRLFGEIDDPNNDFHVHGSLFREKKTVLSFITDFNVPLWIA